MEQIKRVSLNDTEYQIIDETALHEDHNTDPTAHADIREQINQLSSENVDITNRIIALESNSGGETTGGEIITETISFLDTATKTEGCYSRWSTSSNVIKTSTTSAWNTYRGAVTEGEEWAIKAYSVGDAYAVLFVNSGGQLVSTVPTSAPSSATAIDETVTVPTGAVEMIVNEEANQINNYLGVNGVVVEKTITTGGGTTNNHVQFLDYATKTTGFFYSDDNTTTASEAWNYYRGSIPANAKKVQLTTMTTYAARAIYFLDSSGNIITMYPEERYTAGTVNFSTTVNIPSDAVTMIVNERDIQSALVTLIYESQSAGNASSFLYGKVLLACGDSITDAYDLDAMDGSYLKSYAELTADRNGMTFEKDAVSGSTIAYNEGGTDAVSTKAFSNTRYLNLPEFDYLTIWFGWNDGANSTLGTIEDTDNTTFYGAYKKVLEHLVTNNPTKKIGIVVPKLKANQSLIKPDDMANAVREISRLYGVPCLDLADYNKCSSLWGVENLVQQARNNALTFDGTHPNQDGHEYLSSIYENFIKSL